MTVLFDEDSAAVLRECQHSCPIRAVDQVELFDVFTVGQHDVLLSDTQPPAIEQRVSMKHLPSGHGMGACPRRRVVSRAGGPHDPDSAGALEK